MVLLVVVVVGAARTDVMLLASKRERGNVEEDEMGSFILVLVIWFWGVQWIEI